MNEHPHAPLKQCARCKQEFPPTLDFFHAKTRNKDHLRESCKECCGSSKRGIPKLPDGYKQCPDCKQVFPRTTEYFFANKSARGGGIDAYCKTCKHARYVESCANEEQKRMNRPEKMICNKCNEEKFATEQFFERSPVSQYGLNTVCRDCRNTRKVNLFRQNPEKTRTRERGYAKQKSLRAKRKYHLHLEEVRAYRRARYASNPERIKAYQHRYNTSDRAHVVYRARGHRRRARKLAVPGSHTAEQIQDQLKRQKHKCYYCQKKLEKVKGKYIYHVDHIVPITRDGSSNGPENLVVACQSCNCSKGNKLPHEWAQGGRLL